MARKNTSAKRKADVVEELAGHKEAIEQKLAEQPAAAPTESKARGRQKAVIPPGKKVWSIAELEEKGYKTTSAKVRFLHSEEWPRGAIADHLGIRYQHVRNVLITPVEKPLDKRQAEKAAEKAE